MYKLVSEFRNHYISDTDTNNYGIALNARGVFKDLVEFVIEFSEKHTLPLDFLIKMNNNLINLGELYIDNQISKFRESEIRLSKLTMSVEDDRYSIDRHVFYELVDHLNELGTVELYEGFYSWESIWEQVRALYFPDLPKRVESSFFFENIESCDLYSKRVGMGVICKAHVLRTDKIFKGDMNLIDELMPSTTAANAKEQANKYWEGSNSLNSLTEIIFQGRFQLEKIRLTKLLS